MKKVLSIAGSDCSGGAGVQADIKTFSAHGVFGMSVITAVVAENTRTVMDIQEISPEIVARQMDAVFQDIGADSVKIGMLPRMECMEAVAERLCRYKPANIVIDPVMYAKNGCALMRQSSVRHLMRLMLPLAYVLTPNIPEAERIIGRRISGVSDMEEAAKRVAEMGCGAVVIKGGHHFGNAVDVLFDGRQLYRFDGERIETRHTHGTGCTFSSAIAARLALGEALPNAVRLAKEYVTTAIRYAPGIGGGSGPVNHFYNWYRGELGDEG